MAHSSTPLRIQCQDIEAGRQRLLHSAAQADCEIERPPALELCCQLRDRDHHTLQPWRAPTEDEYGFDLEIPCESAWLPEAEKFLKVLLRGVPALFRGWVRKNITRTTEALSVRSVDQDTVIRAAILSTARIMRHNLRSPLVDLGVDLDKYKEEFED